MPSGIIKALANKLGHYYIRKGTEYCFRCPRCNDHKYRMEVNTKIGFFCFHCGWKGSISDLEFEMTGEYPLLRDQAIERRFDKDTCKVFLTAFKSEECTFPAGFSIAWSENEKLFCLLKTLLSSKGIDFSVDWGWGFSSKFRFHNRVIIPVKEEGKVVCWVARTLTGETPKEIAPSSSVSNRSHYVYGIDNIEKGDKIIIVEGIFDCEKLKSYGYKSVSIMGSHISDIQVGKILSKEPRRIYIMFDGDVAGREGNLDAYCKISKRFDGYCLDRIFIPDGKDPDDLTKEEVRGLLYQY